MKKSVFSLFLFCFSGLLLFPVERLIVNNIEITDFTRTTDLLGDGSIVFEPESSTLTLNGANITKGASGKGLEFAEFPGIYFEGPLTLHLKGNNKITLGSDSLVMGERLLNNAIVGNGTLIITGEKKSTLSINGMVNSPAFIQKGGNVSIVMENKHSKINKWGLYCNNSIDIQGGSLSILVSGNKANRALMLDGDGTLSYGPAAKLYEGDAAPGLLVKELTLSKGLTKESKRFVKILVSE